MENTRGNKREEVFENSDEILTTKEAATLLKVSEKSLLNMCCNGMVPYYKLGRRNRFRLCDLRSLLLANKKGATNGHKIR
ncbi:MAG: helix-turn-helix domain-containing protein [Deltaproteobacteria bacterium]|nr:helix-turn-helix domain-containing protein [Deltaproteobacteria bacterium]